MNTDEKERVAAEGVVLLRMMGDRQNSTTELPPGLATRLVNYLANSTAALQEVIASEKVQKT